MIYPVDKSEYLIIARLCFHILEIAQSICILKIYIHNTCLIPNLIKTALKTWKSLYYLTITTFIADWPKRIGTAILWGWFTLVIRYSLITRYTSFNEINSVAPEAVHLWPQGPWYLILLKSREYPWTMRYFFLRNWKKERKEGKN